MYEYTQWSGVALGGSKQGNRSGLALAKTLHLKLFYISSNTIRLFHIQLHSNISNNECHRIRGIQ